MNLIELHNLATQNGIQVHSVCCPKSTAISLNMCNNSFIGIDRAVFKSETMERQVLAHELSHTLTNAYYDDSSNIINVKRMEYRATVKEVELLIPRAELENMLCEDITLWDLSEYFNVPPELIKKAMWIYYKKEV